MRIAGRPRSLTALDRFTEKYEVDDAGCWLWTSTVARGYATFGVGPTKVRAARWAYEHFIGLIPPGREVDHLCRNRRCVNPRHLELVTHAENCHRARLDVCRAGLHDLTDPVNRRPGVRGCYACKKARIRERYARRQAGAL